jgi:ArsR family transcriptional regulator, arsenate/arsenite/antimonite-responsive transcriptional repressor
VSTFSDADVTRFADRFAAMGAEPRLRIVRLLLTAHPKGMTAGEIGGELSIAASTLSHHLERLKREDVIAVQREGTFLRYTANTAALEGIMHFLFDECCSRNNAINPQELVWMSPPSSATSTPKPRAE